MKFKPAILILSLILSSFILSSVRADELSDVDRELMQKQSQYKQTSSEVEKIKKEVTSLSKSIGSTEAQLNQSKKKAQELKDQVNALENKLAERKDFLDSLTTVRDEAVRSLYKRGQPSSLEFFLSEKKLSFFAERYAFEASALGDLSDSIKNINQEIALYEGDKTELDKAKADLDSEIAKIDSQLANQKKQLSQKMQRQSALSSTLNDVQASIKNLTARQQELIRQKLAATAQNSTVGEVAPPSTTLPEPSFSPAYAFSTYGYPHRVGMNQYGAYGRAKAGQDYQTILRAYYTGIAVGAYSVPPTIVVNGCNSYGQCFDNQTFDFEDYLKHIYEMPSSWPIEALKAQAVAARTYAVKYGSPICPSESCQVIKYEYNASAWQQAVDETRGIVITYGGAPISAWYSSTDGGYTRSAQQVWGGYVAYALGIGDFDSTGWPGGSYDGPKYGNSPWFHKAWGDRSGGGGYNPWLTADETADIFNAVLLSQANSSYNQYLTQPDKGGWSPAQVKSELAKLGISDIGSISGIFTTQDGTGYTDGIYVSSSTYGNKRFDGYEFRAMYNLRSIGTLVIWTSLYDVIIQ